MRVLRQKLFGAGMNIGEIASPAAGDADFLASGLGVIDEQNSSPAPSGFGGAEHASSACADDQGVEIIGFHSNFTPKARELPRSGGYLVPREAMAEIVHLIP
jgi:hypothetical protein